MARLLRSYPATAQHSHLLPPTVVFPPPPLAPPIRVTLACRPKDVGAQTVRRQPKSFYTKATIIAAGIAFHGPGVRLTDPVSPNFLNGRQAKSHLSLPTVVTPASTFIASPIHVTFASKIPFRRPWSQYIGPRVIPGPAAQLGGTLVQYVRTPRTTTKPFLRAPVLTPATAFVASPIRVELAAASRPTPKSVLRKPTDTQGLEDQGKVATHLAYSRRGKPSSRLAPPAVVGPVLARPTATHLSYSSRGKPKPRLAPPAVVAPILARPTDITLTRIKPAAIHSTLRRPTDLVDQQDLGSVRVHLSYSRRGVPKTILRKPAVVAPVLARPIDVTLAPQKRGIPKSRLEPPTVVAPVLAPPISTTLVRIRPVATRWLLRKPVDLVDRDDLGFVRVHLAYALRGKPKSRLAPPTVVAPVLARQIDVTLVRIRPVRTTAIIRRPVDLVDQQDVGTVRAHLAYSLRGKPKSRLFLPTVVAPVLARPTDITLARIKPALTHPILRRPTDLVDAQDLGSVRVYLAYSSRGKPKARLAPPTVVAPVLARAISVKLVRIHPVAVHSILRRPTDLVDQQDLGFVRVHLARIRPVAVSSTLRPPVVIDLTPQTKYVDLHLAYSVRGEPKSLLRPASLFTPQAKAETVLAVTLAYSRRGTPKSNLRPPAVIDVRPQVKVIATSLAPSSRRRATSFLTTPAVTSVERELQPVSVHLVRIRPVATHPQLLPPAVVTPFVPPAPGDLRGGRRKKLESIYDMNEEEAAMIAAILADL